MSINIKNNYPIYVPQKLVRGTEAGTSTVLDSFYIIIYSSIDR